MTAPTDPRVQPGERGQRVSADALNRLCDDALVGKAHSSDTYAAGLDLIDARATIAEQAAEIARLREEALRATTANSVLHADVARLAAERDEARKAASSWKFSATRQQIPETVEPSRQAIVEAVEEWVNRARGGDATVDEIAVAVLQAAVNAGWVREPDEKLKTAEARVAELVEALRAIIHAATAVWGRNDATDADFAEVMEDEMVRAARLVSGEAKDAPSPAEGERS